MQSSSSTYHKMHRFSCTTNKYNALYSRYLKDPAKLLEMASYNTAHELLDLCGGTGAISLAALKLGANPAQITLVDLNPRCKDPRIKQLKGHAIDAMQTLCAQNKTFDIAVCRQAFAYLDIEDKAGIALANTIAALLRPGGRFVFNSFIRPCFHAKTYRFAGDRYIELAGYLRRRVFRLQVNLRKGYDLTISKWHREERIFEIFNPYFSIETRWSDNAVYWICTRRTAQRDA